LINGTGRQKWLSGVAATLVPPIDWKPAVLNTPSEGSTARLVWKATATTRFRTADGHDHEVLTKIESNTIENATAANGLGMAMIFNRFETFIICVWLDGKSPPWRQRIHDETVDLLKVSLNATKNAQGDPTEKGADLTQVPAESRDVTAPLTNELIQLLDLMAVSTPLGPTQAGQSWKGSREAPINVLDSSMTGKTDLTYTFQGVKTVNGRDFGIVKFEGMLKPAKEGENNLTGQVHGTAAVDLAVKRISQVAVTVDAKLQVQFNGEILNSTTILEATLSRQTLQP
jgi:hypothetical protein